MSDPGNDDPHIDVAQTWGPAYNIIFEQNIFANSNRGHQGVFCEQLSGDIHNITFRNNIFIMDSDGSYLPGINIKSSTAGWVEDIVIVSNTFIRPEGVGEYAIWLRDVRNFKVMNNIFYDYGKESCPYLQLGTVEELEVGYNCVYTSNGVPPTGGAYPNDLWMVDPEFVDFENNNFHLRADSPLIDTGTNIAGIVDNDFDGAPRPQGAGFDIGAYEFSPFLSIEITKPKEEYLYIFDQEIMPLENTMIIGKITVEIDAYDEDGIDRIEFYIDDVLKSTYTESPYEWTWNEFVIGVHEIKVVAYDNEGNKAEDEMNVIIFNIGM